MFRSNLGQEQEGTTIISSSAMLSSPGANTAPSAAPVASITTPIQTIPTSYVVPSTTTFAKYLVSRPGQPYVLNVPPQQVEQAIYKGLPTEKSMDPVAPAQPQPTDVTAVATMDNGLQVPVYLLKRDAERKQAQADYIEMLDSQVPPRFYAIGAYSVKFPAKAAIMALMLGMLIGKLWAKV